MRALIAPEPGFLTTTSGRRRGDLRRSAAGLASARPVRPTPARWTTSTRCSRATRRATTRSRAGATCTRGRLDRWTSRTWARRGRRRARPAPAGRGRGPPGGRRPEAPVHDDAGPLHRGLLRGPALARQSRRGDVALARLARPGGGVRAQRRRRSAMASEQPDAIIVGSGAGGATAARVLTERGMRVTVLEKGDWATAEDFLPLDELHFHTQKALIPHVNDDPNMYVGRRRHAEAERALVDREHGRRLDHDLGRQPTALHAGGHGDHAVHAGHPGRRQHGRLALDLRGVPALLREGGARVGRVGEGQPGAGAGADEPGLRVPDAAVAPARGHRVPDGGVRQGGLAALPWPARDQLAGLRQPPGVLVLRLQPVLRLRAERARQRGEHDDPARARPPDAASCSPITA